MSDSRALSTISTVVGWTLAAAGLAVFLIRLQHPGPYGVPAGGNLLAAVLCFAIAGVLLLPWPAGLSGAAARALRGVVLVASPIVLFFALYAILAELEEVVVVYATDSEGDPAQLRLWIVDFEDSAWVSMPRSKMEEHDLASAQVEMLRDGEIDCVTTTFSDREVDRSRTFWMRDEKYAVQRLARRIGMFGDGPDPEGVVLRLDPCP